MIGGALGTLIGCPSYNGSIEGSRNMTEQERAAHAQAMMGNAAMEHCRSLESLERTFRRAIRPRPAPPLQIPHREPVPSLCCLNGRWL